MNFTNIPTTAKYPYSVAFYLSNKMLKQLKKEAKDNDTHVSGTIRRIINSYYKKMKDNSRCFKCGGSLEIIEECSRCVDGAMMATSWLKCIECGQRNNWYEKEQWEKKNA